MEGLLRVGGRVTECHSSFEVKCLTRQNVFTCSYKNACCGGTCGRARRVELLAKTALNRKRQSHKETSDQMVTAFRDNRGMPFSIYSDSGSNFVAAHREL